jgi:hypothetical protein
VARRRRRSGAVRLRALEQDVRWGKIEPDKAERLRQYVAGRSEISAGDQLVLRSTAAAPAIAATANEDSFDEVLVERIAAGDKLAMQVLFARHRTSVYRWLLRFVGNETVAEDLLSEVFFDVWQQAGRFEGRAAVTTWLLSIARFKALSARRRRIDALDETIEAIVAESASPAPRTSLRGRWNRCRIVDQSCNACVHDAAGAHSITTHAGLAHD